MKNTFLYPLSLCLLSLVFISQAQADQPEVGRQAASKYFEKPATADRSPADVAVTDHYLAVHAGKLVSGQAWEWGQHGKEDDAGNYTLGVTYRLDQWNNMDFDIRVDFNQYNVGGKHPTKLSFVPMLIFPDASSRFPLYFGIGAGPGVFFTQVEDKSSLALDYQLILGARFFNIADNAGFFVETGLKNHLLLTTSGQYNGAFLAAGALFTF